MKTKALSILLAVILTIAVCPLTALSEDVSIPYASKLYTKSNPTFSDLKYCYFFVADSYEDYKFYEEKEIVSGFSPEYFKNNVLLVVTIKYGRCVCDTYKNLGVSKNGNGIAVRYSYNKKPEPYSLVMETVVDEITFKKSDVEGVNLKDITVNIDEYSPSGEMKAFKLGHIYYLDESVFQKTSTQYSDPNRPSVSKVKKVSVKKTSNGKKVKVSWKKNSKAQGYRVKISLSKKFKKAKKYNTVIKTIKKNKASAAVKIKNPNKRYYVKVRAYAYYKSYLNGKTKKGYRTVVKCS